MDNWYVNHMKKQVAEQQLYFFAQGIMRDYKQNSYFDERLVRHYVSALSLAKENNFSFINSHHLSPTNNLLVKHGRLDDSTLSYSRPSVVARDTPVIKLRQDDAKVIPLEKRLQSQA